MRSLWLLLCLALCGCVAPVASRAADAATPDRIRLGARYDDLWTPEGYYLEIEWDLK